MKIFRCIIIGYFLFTLYTSCTKEQLVIQDKPLMLDENSAESQIYLRERALDYLNNFQFAQALEVIKLIIDPAVKAEVSALYETNQKIAWNEALMLVKDSDNDTIFFRIPTPESATYTLNCNNGVVQNEAGKLYGWKNYPDLTSITFHNAMLTKFMDMEYLTNLKTISYDGIYQSLFEELYPTLDYTLNLPRPVFHLSKNTALTTLFISSANISELEANMLPDNDNVTFNFNIVSFNENDHLNAFRAKSLRLGGISSRKDFVFANKNIPALFMVNPSSIGVGGVKIVMNSRLKKIDVSESNLKTLSVSYHAELEELVTNIETPLLSTLTVHFNPMLTTINIPSTVTTLTVSRNPMLEIFAIPENISVLSITDNISFPHFDASLYPLTWLTLADNPRLQKLTLGEGLSRLEITGNENLMEIVFPENFSESQFTYKNYLVLKIKKDTQITNKQDWMDKYTTYID